jgi:hypothetical protein
MQHATEEISSLSCPSCFCPGCTKYLFRQHGQNGIIDLFVIGIFVVAVDLIAKNNTQSRNNTASS